MAYICGEEIPDPRRAGFRHMKMCGTRVKVGGTKCRHHNGVPKSRTKAEQLRWDVKAFIRDLFSAEPVPLLGTHYGHEPDIEGEPETDDECLTCIANGLLERLK